MNRRVFLRDGALALLGARVRAVVSRPHRGSGDGPPQDAHRGFPARRR